MGIIQLPIGITSPSELKNQMSKVRGDEYDVLGNKVRKEQSSHTWRTMANGLCSLCHVNYATSMHHLIPKAIANKGHYEGHLIPLCRPCHIFIHKAFSHRRLRSELYTPELLEANPLVRQFVSFIQTRMIGKRIRGKRIIIAEGLVSIKGRSERITPVSVF